MKSGTKYQLKYAKEQEKGIITLKPKEIVEQSELPWSIIESEQGASIIEKIEDIDNIIKSLLHSKKSKGKFIDEFL